MDTKVYKVFRFWIHHKEEGVRGTLREKMDRFFFVISLLLIYSFGANYGKFLTVVAAQLVNSYRWEELLGMFPLD